MKIIVCLLLLVPFLPHESFAKSVTAEDVAVLSAAIKNDCSAKRGKFVVLSSDTFPVAKVDVMSDNLDNIAKADILRRNSSPSQLPSSMECKSVKIVPNSTIEKLLKDRPTMLGLSKGFYEAYPGANTVMSLSLPGYSKDRRGALVHISYSCGATCGTSFIIHLQKTNGSWHVVTTSNSWIS